MDKIDSVLQDIARINFAPGKPESSGISGEMLLYGAGSSGLWGGNETDGYSHILITPIAASVPVEPFVITNITRSGNTAELRWQPLPNNTPVRVERTTDLSGPWTAIATNLISGSFNDTNAPTRSAFYRLAQDPILLYGWGNYLSGQTTIPAGLTNVTAIAAGYNHSLALKAKAP